MSDLTADAKYLLGNEAFLQALESCRQQATTSALQCDVKDDEGRRRYLDAVRTVDKVKAHLGALIANTDGSPVELTDFYADKAKSRIAAFLKR